MLIVEPRHLFLTRPCGWISMQTLMFGSHWSNKDTFTTKTRKAREDLDLGLFICCVSDLIQIPGLTCRVFWLLQLWLISFVLVNRDQFQPADLSKEEVFCEDSQDRPGDSGYLQNGNPNQGWTNLMRSSTAGRFWIQVGSKYLDKTLIKYNVLSILLHSVN